MTESVHIFYVQQKTIHCDFSSNITGHAVSMINADQYRSMPDQISGIDTNVDQ